MTNNKSYRVRTSIGEDVNKIDVNINQTFDSLDVLSLKLDQVNTYTNNDSNFGIVVGRVLANGGVGIPNAKVSVFIKSVGDETGYDYRSVSSKGIDGIRYNLLQRHKVNDCHINVGSMPSKEHIIDNANLIEVFDKYYKFTTTTNESGDYMIYGVPTGQQTIHVDLDLSDIGFLSQRPIDLIANGHNIEQFNSPSQFKMDTELTNLVQIHSQNRSLNVYPYLAENTNPTLTRCDFEISYKFDTYCIFMGSVMTDKGDNSIGKNCKCNANLGRVDKLTTSEGEIEMIRKNIQGYVEEYNVRGKKLIDGDGTWCYQIPMNLDYITTNEFGERVPTDNPNKGIATRADVRFRFTLEDTPEDVNNVVRARFLVPNNPDNYDDPLIESDYEFGSKTKDESFTTLFMNNVYTVKSYIPYLRQNNTSIVSSILRNDDVTSKHIGLKYTSVPGDNAHVPYNYLNIDLGIMYRILAVLIDIVKEIIGGVNVVLSALSLPFCSLCSLLRDGLCLRVLGVKICPLRPLAAPFCLIADALTCIPLKRGLCDDGVNPRTYFYGCIEALCISKHTRKRHTESEKRNGETPSIPIFGHNEGFMDCVRMRLADSNENLSYTFINDWINGSLYFPLWYREVKRKRSFFGIFGRKVVTDNFCDADRGQEDIMKYSFAALFGNRRYNLKKIGKCALKRDDKLEISHDDPCGKNCNSNEQNVPIKRGIIKSKDHTRSNTKMYYYAPAEWDAGNYVKLFSTDVVCLGPIYECNDLGVTPIMKKLPTSTYKLPYPIMFSDIDVSFTEKGNSVQITAARIEHAGASWAWTDDTGLCKNYDSGLFYDLTNIKGVMYPKGCLNLKRICELDVVIDEVKLVPDINKLGTSPNNAFDELMIDGFISNDEIINHETRSVFATLNNKNLKTRYNKDTGRLEYDISFMYVDNFDGAMYSLMKSNHSSCHHNYRGNFNLEYPSTDYIRFVYGDKPKSYSPNNSFLKTRNSFYFFFGLKEGKTALNKYNKFFKQDCYSDIMLDDIVEVHSKPNSWCSNEEETQRDSYVAFDTSQVVKPFRFEITNNKGATFVLSEQYTDKFYISNRRVDNLEDLGYSRATLPALQNDVWDYKFYDGNGNVFKNRLSLMNTFLSFDLEVSGFKVEEDDLLFRFNSYSQISNNNAGVVISQPSTRDIGGVITVVNVRDGNNNPINDYKVEVFVNDDRRFVHFDNQTYNGVTVQNDVGHGEGFLGQSGVGLGKVTAIGVPLPRVEYQVKVTEICNGMETENTITTPITVGRHRDLTLYVNGVNVGVFKNFKNDGDFYGWGSIHKVGDIRLLDNNSTQEEIKSMYNYLTQTNDPISPYHWVDEYRIIPDKFTTRMLDDASNFNDPTNVSFKERVIEEINSVVTKRLEVRDTLVNTLIVYSPSGMDIALSANYGSQPYRFKYTTNNTEYNSDYEKNVLTNSLEKNESSYFLQVAPTITKSGNNWRRYRDKHTNVEAKTTLVSVLDSAKKSYPTGIGEREFNAHRDGNFLKLQFINKLPDVNAQIIASMENTPLYKPKDPSLNGHYYTKPAFLMAEVENYRSSGLDEKGNSILAGSNVGSNYIGFHTIDRLPNGEPDEFAFPTRRYAVGEPDEDYLPNYSFENNTSKTYIPILGVNGSVSIGDSLSSHDIEIEPSFNVRFISGNAQDNTLILDSPEFSEKDDLMLIGLEYDGTNYFGDKIDGFRNYDDYFFYKVDKSIKDMNMDEVRAQSWNYGLTNSLRFLKVKPSTFADFSRSSSFLYEAIKDTFFHGHNKGYVGPVRNFTKGKQYYFLIENVKTKHKAISPIFDYTEVKGAYKFDDTSKTIEITVTNVNDLYYYKHYESNALIVVDNVTAFNVTSRPNGSNQLVYRINLGDDYDKHKEGIKSGSQHVILEDVTTFRQRIK